MKKLILTVMLSMTLTSQAYLDKIKKILFPTAEQKKEHDRQVINTYLNYIKTILIDLDKIDNNLSVKDQKILYDNLDGIKIFKDKRKIQLKSSDVIKQFKALALIMPAIFIPLYPISGSILGTIITIEETEAKLRDIENAPINRNFRHLKKFQKQYATDKRFRILSGIACAGTLLTYLTCKLSIKMINKANAMFFPNIMDKFYVMQSFLGYILQISSKYKDSIIDPEILKELKKLKISFACDMPFLQEDYFMRGNAQDLIDCCYYLEYKKIKDDLNKLTNSIAQHQNRDVKS